MYTILGGIFIVACLEEKEEMLFSGVFNSPFSFRASFDNSS
jgi:hypothetical protein